MKEGQRLGNILIAKYEGYETSENHGTTLINYGVDEYGNENERAVEDTYYHSSWDWLMPVIGKISNQCEEPEELDNLKYALLTNNIEEAYYQVVLYIVDIS